MLCQGAVLFQAGEEMLRSKQNPDGTFEHNSYKSPDSVNGIKWEDLEKQEYKKVFEYYKGLIRFRKEHNALRMKNAGDVYSHISDVRPGEENVIAYHIWGNINGETAEAIFAAFNPENEEKEIYLPVGKWSVRICGDVAGNEHLCYAERKFTVPPLSAVVMIK